ncbi:glycosyltransferase [Lentisphaera marina]|uniref:glycosyltransferase family 2 protein n=1 Tax=Lentisphaera marina TaxID=1111041 RepID=UPI0023673032|nr:glycosyltransferase [Lentisphaera marina]MDD7985735.1 glycosyltransferase [Lentisphaera marina]
MLPKISVIMSNYNYENFLERALKAICDQIDYIYEFIIIDDGSTDNSREIIAKYTDLSPKIKYYYDGCNKGIVSRLEELNSLAEGDYIYGAASDDYVLPDFFKKVSEQLTQNPNALLVCAEAVFEDEESGRKVSSSLGFADQSAYISCGDVCRKLKGKILPGHTSILRKSAVDQFGGYHLELKWYCDWYLNLNIALKEGFLYIVEVGAVMRTSTETYSGKKPWSELCDVFEFLMVRLKKDLLYEDFVRCKAFNNLGGAFLLFLIIRPKFWDFLTLVIIKDICWLYMKHYIKICIFYDKWKLSMKPNKQ